jgi:hypothetical protein
VIITVERDGGLRPVKEEGGCELHGEDFSMLALSLTRGEARRGSIVDQKAVMDLGKSLILVVVLLLRVLLLIILLDAQAFKVSLEHVAVLEVMVGGSLVVGTRLLEHLIKDTPTGVLKAFCGQQR